MASWSDFVRKRWVGLSVLGWVLIALVLLYVRMGAIEWFSLGDTDDNMRMMQVRDLLKGQDWYDLRQYRLNPPEGFDMHWSRLVDLPLAALVLIGRLFVHGATAERFAIAIAPLLPLLVVALALAKTVRILIAPSAYLVAIGFLLFAQVFLSMFSPTRIDHHGWQLAMLSLLVLGMVHHNRRTGGFIAGLAMAGSLTIGLELLPYLALAGFMIAIRWVIDTEENARLRAFGTALGIGTALGYIGFASHANTAPRCDALTPVWFSSAAIAALACIFLSRVNRKDVSARMGFAVASGIALVGFFGGLWPQCLGRLEGVSPELQTSWLDNISEARPIYRQKADLIANTSFIPIAGVIGHMLALWLLRNDKARFWQWMPLAVLALASTTLLLFQSRVGAAAQLLAIPGTVMLAWMAVPWFAKSKHMLVRVIGIPASAAIASGAIGSIIANMLPTETPTTTATANAGGKAKPNQRKLSSRCSTLPALKPIGLIPKATMFTFVDLGPRLITVTHHNAIAGPYHRNGKAILDVHHVFDGQPDAARKIIHKHGATYLLICPGLAESTIYAKRSPKGFYMQLTRGQVPAWLVPVTLPASSPFRLWRVTS